MKKLHVIAMADRREELLKGLLHLGCVEISEPSEVLADPQWVSLFQRSGSSLAERKGQLTDVNTALDAIKQYAKLKDGMFIKRHPITEAEFLDAGAAEKAQAACDAVREQLGILTKAQSEAGRLESRAAALKPWESLDLPLERSGTAHTIFRLGVCPGQTDVGAIRVQMEAEGLAAELYEISADKLQKYLLVIVHRGDEEKTQELLRPFGFSAVTFQGMTGTAAENIRSLERELEANKKTQDDAAAAIAASAENRDALRIYADRLRAEAAKEQCAESVLTDETVLYFQGWVPAEQEKAVGAFLTEKGCAWEALDPTEEEIPDVPAAEKQLAHETFEHGDGDVLPPQIRQCGPQPPDGTVFHPVLRYHDGGYGLRPADVPGGIPHQQKVRAQGHGGEPVRTDDPLRHQHLYHGRTDRRLPGRLYSPVGQDHQPQHHTHRASGPVHPPQ